MGIKIQSLLQRDNVGMLWGSKAIMIEPRQEARKKIESLGLRKLIVLCHAEEQRGRMRPRSRLAQASR
jgi:hypothetical protein